MGDASIEAWATVAAAAFTFMAFLVAGLAALYSYRLLTQQTDVTKQLAEIETARAEREAHDFSSRFRPELRVEQVGKTDSPSADDPHWLVHFSIQNTGNFPANDIKLTDYEVLIGAEEARPFT